jgi:hypothetical protein
MYGVHSTQINDAKGVIANTLDDQPNTLETYIHIYQYTSIDSMNKNYTG